MNAGLMPNVVIPQEMTDPRKNVIRGCNLSFRLILVDSEGTFIGNLDYFTNSENAFKAARASYGDMLDHDASCILVERQETSPNGRVKKTILAAFADSDDAVPWWAIIRGSVHKMKAQSFILPVRNVA